MRETFHNSATRTLKVTLAVIITFLLFLVSHTDSFAEAPKVTLGLSVSPPTFEITANPGDTVDNVFKLENVSDVDIIVELDKMDFIATGSLGVVELVDDSDEYSLSSWVTFDDSTVVVPAKKQVTIPFKISIPEDANPGGHFVSLLSRSTQNNIPDQSGALLSEEIGVLVLLRVAGDAEESLKIKSFTTDDDFYQYGPVDFQVLMTNEGNVHLKPTGKITITDFFGRKVKEIELPTKNVLPNADRELDAVWDEESLFGRYTATASLVYGTDDKLVTSSTTFSVFPIQTIAIWAGVIIILGIILYLGRNRIKLATKALAGKE